MEFGLVAPTLVLILAGLLEFGVYFWNKHTIEFATEETGRAVMMKTAISEEEVAADFRSRVSGMDLDRLTATVSKETVGATTFVTINAAYSYNYVLLGGMLGFEPTTIESQTRVPLNATQ